LLANGFFYYYGLVKIFAPPSQKLKWRHWIRADRVVKFCNKNLSNYYNKLLFYRAALAVYNQVFNQIVISFFHRFMINCTLSTFKRKNVLHGLWIWCLMLIFIVPEIVTLIRSLIIYFLKSSKDRLYLIFFLCFLWKYSTYLA